MQQYLDCIKKIVQNGVRKENRTGIAALTIAGAMFEHDMSEGFPLLTTKKMSLRLVASELEFFIKGKTDKQWLQERNNHIWDEWAHPQKAQYGHDEESRKYMRDERDLGPVYGFQWRHFNAPYSNFDADYTSKGFDQLTRMIEKLKSDPSDRRMIVSAWNPLQFHEMALPPCHYAFQVTVIDGALNLLWNQRSVDVMLGLPFNIASYGLLLHLLAKEAKLKEGKLVGFLADTHIYENHIEGAKLQLLREPLPLPRIETSPFVSIFDWQWEHTKILHYQCHEKIAFEIAV